MKTVYICYSGYDYNTALHITSVLEGDNESIIVTRTDLNENIESAYNRIADSNFFVYLISQEALDDTFWRQQLDYAVKIGIPSQGLIVRHPEEIIPSPGGLYPIDLTKGFTPASLNRLHQVLNELPAPMAPAPRLNLFIVLIVVILLGVATYFFLVNNNDHSDAAQISTHTMIPTNRQVLNPTAGATSTDNTNIPTATSSPTPMVTASPTLTLSPTDEPTETPTTPPTETLIPPTATHVRTDASASLSDGSETPHTPESTATISPSNTSTATQTLTDTTQPSATATYTLTNTATYTATATRTFTATATSTRTATATVTPSRTATFTPSKTPTATITPTVDPNSVVCLGAPVSRLLVNEYAVVIHLEGISVRAEPGLSSEWLIYLSVASEVFLVDGPVCANQFRWWEIELEDDETGWVAEGDMVYYYLELIPSPTPTVIKTNTIVPE